MSLVTRKTETRQNSDCRPDALLHELEKFQNFDKIHIKRPDGWSNMVKETQIMRKIDIVGSISIVLGVLAIGAMSLVVLWPLWLGIAAVLAASRLGSFINDNKELLAAKITQVITKLRPKPQPMNGELINSSAATTTVVSPMS